MNHPRILNKFVIIISKYCLMIIKRFKISRLYIYTFLIELTIITDLHVI